MSECFDDNDGLFPSWSSWSMDDEEKPGPVSLEVFEFNYDPGTDGDFTMFFSGRFYPNRAWLRYRRIAAAVKPKRRRKHNGRLPKMQR